MLVEIAGLGYVGCCFLFWFLTLLCLVLLLCVNLASFVCFCLFVYLIRGCDVILFVLFGCCLLWFDLFSWFVVDCLVGLIVVVN